MFNKLFGKQEQDPKKKEKRNAEHADKTVDETEGNVVQIESPAVGYTGQIRRGMWVHHVGVDRIGIVTEEISPGFCYIDYVDTEGNTVITTTARYSQLQQARFSQIPDKRKPDQATAARFGYFN